MHRNFVISPIQKRGPGSCTDTYLPACPCPPLHYIRWENNATTVRGRVNKATEAVSAAAATGRRSWGVRLSVRPFVSSSATRSLAHSGARLRRRRRRLFSPVGGACPDSGGGGGVHDDDDDDDDCGRHRSLSFHTLSCPSVGLSVPPSARRARSSSLSLF